MMVFVIFALCCFMLQSNAFMHQPSLARISTKQLLCRKQSAYLKMIVVDQPEEAKRPIISVGEYFTPPQIDRTNLIVTLIGQGILTAFAFGSGALSGVNVLNNINFDFDSMNFAFTFGTLMLGNLSFLRA